MDDLSVRFGRADSKLVHFLAQFDRLLLEPFPASYDHHRVLLELIKLRPRSKTESLTDILESLSQKASDLAAGLQRSEVRLRYQGPGLYLPSEAERLMRNILIHLVCNSVDHGLESPVERERARKDKEGLILVQATVAGEHVHIVYYDDGRGLNMTALRWKLIQVGQSRGTSAEDAHTIANAIVQARLSTCDHVSIISGRGVGVNAVKSFIEACGGKIAIEFRGPETLDGYQAFQFAITLPGQIFIQEKARDDARQPSDNRLA